MTWQHIDNGTITSPRGFSAGATFAGIKAGGEKYDLAILYLDVPCTAVAIFTANKIKAAPVVLCYLQNGTAQAVVVIAAAPMPAPEIRDSETPNKWPPLRPGNWGLQRERYWSPAPA